MSPTAMDFLEAVSAMASCIPFFPKDEVPQRIIIRLLKEIISTKEQLDWLTFIACSNIRDWGKSGGITELRGLFCTRFRPRDGRYQVATTPGFTPADLESQYQTREMEDNTRRIESNRQLTEATEVDEVLSPLLPTISASVTRGEFRFTRRCQNCGIFADRTLFKNDICPECLTVSEEPSLQEREEKLKSAPRMTPTRTPEERDRIVAQIASQLPKQA